MPKSVWKANRHTQRTLKRNAKRRDTRPQQRPTPRSQRTRRGEPSLSSGGLFSQFAAAFLSSQPAAKFEAARLKGRAA